jgi:hypothetical protein
VVVVPIGVVAVRLAVLPVFRLRIRLALVIVLTVALAAVAGGVHRWSRSGCRHQEQQPADEGGHETCCQEPSNALPSVRCTSHLGFLLRILV